MPALVVTAGVAGSALALPLLAATSASAAETSTWDKVAECESGGAWSANFGSGSYGGLQFSQEQWKDAGGLDFAERADLASRSQQIAVAERVLASQGPEAWPLCGAPAGLTRQGPAAEVDPGLPGTPRDLGPTPSRPDDTVPYFGSAPSTDFGAPTAPAPSQTPSFLLPDYPIGAPSGLPVMPPPDLPTQPPGLPGDPTAPTSPTDPTAPTPPVTDPTAPPAVPVAPADPTAPATPSDPASPTGPAAPADPAAPEGPTAPASPSAGAEEGGGKHRGPAAVEAPAAPDAASDPTYTVKAGDSLVTIADANGVKGGWNALYEANEQVIGGDADLIKPGQNLDLTHQ